MNEEKLAKTSGISAGVAAACCFGLLNVIFSLAGMTMAITRINQYGDYLFFPAYSFFATLFVWSIFRIGNKGYAIPALGLALYFGTFGMTYAILIVAGILLGGFFIWQWAR